MGHLNISWLCERSVRVRPAVWKHRPWMKLADSCSQVWCAHPSLCWVHHNVAASDTSQNVLPAWAAHVLCYIEFCSLNASAADRLGSERLELFWAGGGTCRHYVAKCLATCYSLQPACGHADCLALVRHPPPLFCTATGLTLPSYVSAPQCWWRVDPHTGTP